MKGTDMSTKKLCRYKFLVIDDADLLENQGLNRAVNPAVKHPEPVIKLDAPWDTDDDVFDFASVVYDEQDDLFKMWYTVYTVPDRDAYRFYCPCKMAYAFSEDGINWQRPVLNLIEVNGSTKNNFVTPEMGNFCHSVILDPSDAPHRRFKMLFMAESGYGSGGETHWAGFHVPICLAYSADGIHWDRPKHVNPVLRGISDGPFTFFYDVERRKYILMSRRVPNLPRDISLYESYDLVNWEDHGRIMVPGDQYDATDATSLHAISLCRYEDFILGMVNVLYTLPESESYSVFSKPPADYPSQRLGTMDLQLAYSRDGRTWTRAFDRSVVVTVGPDDAPDAGFIYPINNPIVREAETWIYYSARCYRHNDWDSRGRAQKVLPRHEGYAMLAKMPEDHWVSLNAGGKEGYFLTKPWGPPHEVFVNADAEGGAIEAELITPYREPIPNFTRAECIPITANGKNQEIKWKCGRHPWDFATDYRGGVLMKFYLKNAKLYSYTFTLPDPDGKLERDRLNTRWRETIKHRSDNWGRLSTEPAIGLPPGSGPSPEKP
jgi:hypothetical protein